ncbi:MAG: Gfo/Idh/MocA family oxidoreductase [Planctomycetia bacterium]|nr:Gfo/Idh/MocA family oxidoreductase [Planctomycetia bacterium]
MDRRTFLAAAATSSLVLPTVNRAQAFDKLRVAVIGHTGRGDFGHGLDTVWLHVSETEIVGVADADERGLAEAKRRLRVDDGFSDYRQLLTTVKPEVVAVCPRQPDQHRDMCLAAIEAGAKGIYMAEADEIIAACEKHNAKLAVAHRNRYHPTLPAIDKLIASGEIGKPLELRGRGKGDRRGGAEDLWVLGAHVLNLIHYFGGAPKTCSAVLMQDGRRVIKDDVREGNEALGLLAGNEVHARYEMERGLIGYFDSIANDGTKSAGFGLQIIGSEGIIDINCDKLPLAYLVPGNPFQPTGESRPWIPITSAGAGKPEPLDNLDETVSHHVGPARDLIEAIRQDRQPLCSVYEGAMTVEMICAVFASHHESSKAVAIPLEARGNELARL